MEDIFLLPKAKAPVIFKTKTASALEFHIQFLGKKAGDLFWYAPFMRDSEKTNCHHKGSIVMPQKSKLNAEEKVEIIRKYQQGEISLAQAAREASVETATIYRWSTRYEAEGAGGFLSYQKNRVYPSELKLKAVLEYLSGSGGLREISKKYKLRNERQLSNWIKERYNLSTRYQDQMHRNPYRW